MSTLATPTMLVEVSAAVESPAKWIADKDIPPKTLHRKRRRVMSVIVFSPCKRMTAGHHGYPR
jgi:hypothetical protein